MFYKKEEESNFDFDEWEKFQEDEDKFASTLSILGIMLIILLTYGLFKSFLEVF